MPFPVLPPLSLVTLGALTSIALAYKPRPNLPGELGARPLIWKLEQSVQKSEAMIEQLMATTPGDVDTIRLLQDVLRVKRKALRTLKSAYTPGE